MGRRRLLLGDIDYERDENFDLLRKDDYLLNLILRHSFFVIIFSEF